MGITEFMWADIDRAYENIKIAYDLSKKGKDIYLRIFILMVYTVLLRDLDDVESENKSNELEEITETNRFTFLFDNNVYRMENLFFI